MKVSGASSVTASGEVAATTRPKKCAVSECERASRARGYCMKHYMRLQKTGQVDELPLSLPIPNVEAPMSIYDEAACQGVDPATFFPRPGQRQAVAKAREICRACPVRAECADFAIRNSEPFGIWGGLTETERREVKRRQRA